MFAAASTSIPRTGPYFAVVSEHRELFRAAGFASAEDLFKDDRLNVWRDLDERDNSTLDFDFNGQAVRLHVKRDKRPRPDPVDAEAFGIMLLERKGISAAPLVASGRVADGRSFVVTRNLDGYVSADRLIEQGHSFEEYLGPTLDVVTRLHRAGLHHRDLYLNHFYIRTATDEKQPAVRLIDAGRVKPLPAFFFRQRWIVKDVAQFIFSLGQIGVPREKQEAWLSRYSAATRDYKLPAAVWGKVRSIAKHDKALVERKPTRNVRLADGN
ncbi:MAG: lipopolysaccharide kinase InaA family protein [Tepidisphaeraceae bacterium]